MMLSPTAIDAVRAILQPRDFYRESHARIYRAAVALHELGSAVDAIAVADELQARGDLDTIGGRERIREIATLVPAVSNAPTHAAIIVKLARFRALITLGSQIEALGWDAGDIDISFARANELYTALQELDAPQALDVETWHRFETQAHDPIPVIVEGLWPEQAFGFIAAPPKKGKTWVALALAIAVAAGKPLFGHYTVPAARPVLYVALEGHRAAIRARVGALARGMNLDPDGDQLANLHFLYKPRGINLADHAWAQRLRRAANQIDAALTIVDVLRAGARIKENDQGEFTNLRHNLQPINDDGRSLALLHHNVKLSEISKERDPGERMSGSGAMFGALDAAIYITGSENHATRLRLSFDTRDLATPNDISIELAGIGTGENGGYTYLDTAAWHILAEEEIAETDLKASPAEIYDWLAEHGGEATNAEIRFALQVSDRTVRDREPRLEELGIEIIRKRGLPTRYRILTPEELAARSQTQETLDLGNTTPESVSEVPTSEVEPLNQAAQSDTTETPETKPLPTPESADLQDNPTSEPRNPPTEGAYARARETPTAPQPHPDDDIPF